MRHWKVGCPYRFSGKFYAGEHYRRRFKLTPSRVEGVRGRYYCYSGIYEQIGVGQRVHSGGLKIDRRGFLNRGLIARTRKCTYNLRYGERDQLPLLGVIRRGMFRKKLCDSGKTTSARVPQNKFVRVAATGRQPNCS
jgi:hypothetical protein